MEEVLSSEIGDDALLDLTAFAVAFDDTDVFVDGAAFGADFTVLGYMRTIITTDFGESRAFFGEF